MRYHIASSFLVLTLIGTIGAGESRVAPRKPQAAWNNRPQHRRGNQYRLVEQPKLRLVAGAFDNDGQFFSIALMPGNTDSQLARVDTMSGAATVVAWIQFGDGRPRP